MGMYDTFEVNKTITCPHCSKNFQLTQGLQSKNFEKVLEYYEIGDFIEYDDKSYITGEYDWCPHCNNTVDLYIGIYKGIYIGIEQNKDIINEKIANVDILNFYKKSFKKYKETDIKYRKIYNSISNTIELFSKSNKNKFMLGLLLTKEDVFDYSIITTLKNIINKFKG